MLLTLVLITSLAPSARSGALNAPADVAGLKSASANSRYAMYVNEDTLALTIVDKVTGAYMESYTSYDDGLANKTWWGAMNGPAHRTSDRVHLFPCV